MNEELKPCPFCGAHSDAARAFPRTCNKDTPYNATDRAYPLVRCLGCGASQDGSDWTGVETAVAKWNHRATPPAAVAVPEGWRLVPIEPTAAMQAAGSEAIRFNTTAINKLWTGNKVFRAMLAAAPAPATVATEAVAQNARDAAFIDVVTHGQGFLQIGADGMETHIPAESVVHEAVAQDDHPEHPLDMVAQGGGVDAERAEIIASLHGIAEFVGSPIAGGRGKWKRHALTAAALLTSTPAVPVGDGWVKVPRVATPEIVAELENMLTRCHTVEESWADLLRAALPAATKEG